MRPLLCLILIALLPAACERVHEPASDGALDLVLVPHVGDTATDETIRRAQDLVRTGHNRTANLENLGWAYIAKARTSRDEGFYHLAEACARAIEETSMAPDGSSPSEALLLRGHVAANFHRFAEAEQIASELVARRGLPFDHLLLGDARMEQGKIEAAIASYQTGVDLKPGLQSYARVGWMRWLIGDLPGAIEATELAARAASPSDPESLAWVRTRLGHFRLVAGDPEGARSEIAFALGALPDYPPALLLQSRLALAEGNAGLAVETLRDAVEIEPLPDFLWAYAEALREDGQEKEAKEIEAEIAETGPRDDPRTCSLFLSTRGLDAGAALALAEEELKNRSDFFTRDALAWALHANGRSEEALREIDLALSGGTVDARLFLHAAVIARAVGELDESADWAALARAHHHTLLPSERRLLASFDSNLTASESSAADSPNQPIKQTTP